MAGKQRMIQFALVVAASQILSGNSQKLDITGIETNSGQTARLRCLAILDDPTVLGYTLNISSESNGSVVPLLEDSMQYPCLNSTVSMVLHWSNVTNVEKDKNYTCTLKREDNGIVNGTVNINGSAFVKDPPVMSSAPRVVNKNATYMRIEWDWWTEGDGGDGVVEAYIVYLSDATGPRPPVDVDKTCNNHTVTDLTPYSQYSVRVAARRKGPGGEGPKSNITMVTTNCTYPNKPVFGVRINYNYQKSNNTVRAKVSWQAPPRSDWNCANISMFEIIVNKSQIDNTSESMNISRAALVESVLLRTTNGSQETTLPPTTTELLLTTEAGPDGIYYTGGWKSSIDVYDLKPQTQYNFTIRFYNNKDYPSPDATEGPSRTPGPEPSRWWNAWRIGAIAGGGAAFIILVVIVIILLVRARRRRKSRARSNVAPSAKALDEMVRKQNKGNKGRSEGAGGDGMRPQSEHLYEAITFQELEDVKPTPKKNQPAPKTAASDNKTSGQPNKFSSLQRPSEAKPNVYQTEKMTKHPKKPGGQTGAPPRGQNTTPGGPKKPPNQAKPGQSRSPAEKGSKDETKESGQLKPPSKTGPEKTSPGVKVGPGNLKPVGQSRPGKTSPGVKVGPGNLKPPGQAGKGRTPPGVKRGPGQTGANKGNARRDQTRNPGVGRGKRGQAGQGGTTPGRSVKKPQGRGKPPTPDPPPEQYYMPLQTDARC